MKAIYTGENVRKTLIVLQRRYNNFYNKNYSIQQIIYAFNKLPGKYQDLLLKPNKNENDKGILTYAYDQIRKYLHESKNVDENIKVNIKNIKQEEIVKKSDVTIEDVESDHGDKWVKQKEEDKPLKVVTYESVKKAKENKGKEDKIIQQDLTEINKVSKAFSKDELNSRIKTVVLTEYISERQKIDIEGILDNLDMDEDDKYIIMIKYDNNSVKTNSEVSKETGLIESYIDEVVERFFSQAIELKKKKIYKLEKGL